MSIPANGKNNINNCSTGWYYARIDVKKRKDIFTFTNNRTKYDTNPCL